MEGNVYLHFSYFMNDFNDWEMLGAVWGVAAVKTLYSTKKRH